MALTRRELIERALLTALAACTPRDPGLPPLAPATGAFRTGRYLGDVPFFGEGGMPFATVEGEGLDGEQIVDVGRLGPDTLLTPTSEFYVRTLPPALPGASWPIRVGETQVDPAALAAEAEDQGAHLLECSGNSRDLRFGLISVARWAGVPIRRLLAGAGLEGVRYVRVHGIDHAADSPQGSIADAAWIFAVEDLAAAGAFLATAMNGAPLPAAHGAPARLFVPGWWGCSCTKWVDAIEAVPDDAPATPQMREYAGRTHQEGVPELARDYKPARLQLAAMAVRVERWVVDGDPRYRVVGLSWGGAHATEKLSVRFHKSGKWYPVSGWLTPPDPSTWALWWIDWRPAKPGKYRIRLRCDDESVPAARLAMGWYDRTVEILPA